MQDLRRQARKSPLPSSWSRPVESLVGIAAVVLVLALAGAVSHLAAETGARPPACGWG